MYEPFLSWCFWNHNPDRPTVISRLGNDAYDDAKKKIELLSKPAE
jgi:hypothetical protein